MINRGFLMKRKLFIVFVGITIGCILVILGFYLYGLVSPIIQPPNNCVAPPDSFSEVDLVGTWVAGTPDRYDTLIIKPDNTYIQTIHIAYLNYDYKSDPQAWWLEYMQNTKQNIPYLHLIGMRLCASNPDFGCENVGGGGTDFCRGKWINMENEGVLIVLGLPKSFIQTETNQTPSPGVSLWLPSGSENTWIYAKQKP
jgi:hypothetical protein